MKQSLKKCNEGFRINIKSISVLPQCPNVSSELKKSEIQTQCGLKLQDNQTKSEQNLTLFWTGFTKT